MISNTLAKYAVIDVGSNSVRLMIATYENGLIKRLTTQLNTTRLLEGLIHGILSHEAMERSAIAIAEYAAMARNEGCQEVYAFATSASRDAKNRQIFVEMVKEYAHLTLDIISGDEEATLAYLGAGVYDDCGIIDIGGGSTELIVGHSGKLLNHGSVQVGAVRLKKMVSDSTDVDLMIATAKEILAPLAHKIIVSSATKNWVGVGGTITTLAQMELEAAQYDAHAIQDTHLSHRCTKKWLCHIAPLSMDERYKIIGLSAKRADIIPYGLAILCAFFELFPNAALVTSDKDNLDGYLKQRLSKI